MAVEYYDMRHEGAEIDDAVDLVLTGDIIKNNTSNTVAEGEELPVSGDAVFKAIEENGDALNANIIDLREAVDGKVDKEDGARLITEEEVEKFNDKAEKEGVYPNFVSGWSSNLTGRGDATERMFVYAPTAGDLSIGDGVARIKSIKGNTIIWNQLFKLPKLDGNYAITSNATDEGIVNGMRRIVSTDGTAQKLGIQDTVSSPRAIKGHKYYIAVTINTDGNAVNWTFNGALPEPQVVSTPSVKKRYDIISTATESRGTAFQVRVIKATFMEATNQIFIDLTQMFGAGNEPSTVEEFKALFPNEYYEYNAGEFRSLSADGIKTTGFNQWDEEWENGTIDSLSGDKLDNPTYADGKIRSTNYIEVLPNTKYYCGKSGFMYWEYDNEYNYIPIGTSIGLTPTNGLFTTSSNCRYIRFRVIDTTYHNDICINLSHTGYRNGEYEPYEEHALRLGELSKYMPLRSAGAAYDEINKNAKVTRIGVVDLGELSWGISPDGTLLYSTHWGVEINGKAGINVLCDKYEAYSYISATVKDKTISIQVGYTSRGKTSVMVRDSAYTDPTAFKEAMKGVMLYYELAEPNEEVFAEAINLNYLVSDFGTEEAIVAEDSAPFRADVIYQFNAQDRIRKNSEVIATIDSKYLAATPSGNPNHNLYVSLGAVWSDAGWKLNGVPLTNEEIDVSYLCSVPYLHRIQESAWGNMPSYFINRFKTNFCSLLGVAYNSPEKAFNANSIGYAAMQLQVVRFQGFRNETSYKVFINNPSYMFGSCTNLREIQDYLDVSLCTSFVWAFSTRTTSLETVWLIGLKASINFAGTPVLKKECLLYMIQKAAPTSAITITVHADVYAWASTDAEVQAALAAQPLITLISA